MFISFTNIHDGSKVLLNTDKVRMFERVDANRATITWEDGDSIDVGITDKVWEALECVVEAIPILSEPVAQ